MLGEYYSSKAILDKASANGIYHQVKSILTELQAADVEPMIQGTWLDDGADYWKRGRTSTRYHCSCCNRRAGEKQVRLYKFCPGCGARMQIKLYI